MDQAGQSYPFWKGGVFCVRLNHEPSDRQTQPIAVGIDPGSKKEALVVKSRAHTYLNVQADAVTWVKPGPALSQDALPLTTVPSGAWGLASIHQSPLAVETAPLSLARPSFPAHRLHDRRYQGGHEGPAPLGWQFLSLRSGQAVVLSRGGQTRSVKLRLGWETKQLRDTFGLKKTKAKLAETFRAHCVDAWVLAWAVVGGHSTPEQTRLFCLTPLQWHRRQLHRLQPEKAGKRKPYGGTRSLGFTRGTLVRHPKYGLAFVGGTLDGRVSLHHQLTGKRLCQNAKPTECRVRTVLKWRSRLLPVPKEDGSPPRKIL